MYLLKFISLNIESDLFKEFQKKEKEDMSIQFYGDETEEIIHHLKSENVFNVLSILPTGGMGDENIYQKCGKFGKINRISRYFKDCKWYYDVEFVNEIDAHAACANIDNSSRSSKFVDGIVIL
jgi:hypothetical protein